MLLQKSGTKSMGQKAKCREGDEASLCFHLMKKPAFLWEFAVIFHFLTWPLFPAKGLTDFQLGAPDRKSILEGL